MKQYNELVISSDYEEALANLKMVLPVLEKIDPNVYKQYCQEAEKIILERVSAHSDRFLILFILVYLYIYINTYYSTS